MIGELLRKNIEQSALDISENVQRKLIQYLQLLSRWNRAYNLTAVRDPKQMVTRHIMDSLSVADYVQGERILDVGSGAGLPGVPLALCLPHYRFVLLDSNGKKTRFMNQVVQDLALDNVEVVKERVEDYSPDEKFNTIISRAYSTVANLVRESVHLLSPDGKILAMKGSFPVAELDELEIARDNIEVVRLHVPGVNAERHLVIVNYSQIVSHA